MLKDFKDDDLSNSGIVRFSRLVMSISRLTIFTRYLSFYLKKNFKHFHNENKKTNLEVLSKSFAFSENNHLKLAVDQRKFVAFKVFSNVIV